MKIATLVHKDAKDAKVELLGRTELFADCSRRRLERVAAVADELAVGAGSELTVEGRPGREFFVLIAGAAEVSRAGQVVNTLGPGDVFGEIAVLGRGLRSATVVATEPSRVLVLTDRDFRTLAQETPSLPPKLLALVSERLEARRPAGTPALWGARRARGT